MKPSLVLVCALLSCCNKDPWAGVPTACASSSPTIGAIEAYVIDGKSRGIQYRFVPDVLSGSVLIERQGRLIPQRNEIGVIEVAATERPADGVVHLTYAQALADGGRRAVEELFRCNPIAPK
jgi:hypothetical protein